MPGKYFPIVTDPSCRLKWSWSTLYLNSGTTASCHRASGSDIPENFNEFHNTSTKVQDRATMLSGQWPGNGCEYCKNIEEAGGTSDRKFQNQIPDVYPKELELDNTLTQVSPSIVEVFFANTCNLACVYCSAKYSSAIQAENALFGGSLIPDKNFEYVDNRYRELSPKFWKWFRDNSQTLQRFQILGGEPFLQRDLHALIDYLLVTEHPNLELNLVTNLALKPSVIKPILEKLSATKDRVKRIDIQTSIDAWDSSQEYVRHGLKLDTFDTNMTRLLAQGTYRVGLLSTISSLSINGMPALAKKYLEWGKIQEIFWYMHLVLPNDTIFDPTIFDFGVFENSLEQTRAILPNTSWDDLRTLEVFDGIVLKLKQRCSTNISKQQELLTFLEQNDQRRDTNWRKDFPWLVTVFKENHVV